MPLSPYPLAVVYQSSESHPEIEPQAIELAKRLSLPHSDSWAEFSRSGQEGFVLLLTEQGLALQQLGKKAPGPIRVDFGAGAMAHRRKFGGGAGQMIAKAVGVKASRPLHVLDATAGLGKDAFVLASLGCLLTLHERNPVVAELLADGLRRGRQTGDLELATILERMTLLACDSLLGLANNPQLGGAPGVDIAPIDIVYLDPMFPDRSKSASVKKDMAVFHQVVGKDEDADELLPLARSVAQYRVVVKRPRKAPFLNSEAPTYQLSGKTSRYDIYVNKKIPD
ncbi:class I SAM-dependent methyltransferase [Aestuariicella hydrocarbonica]|uniref:Ribosomal RNA small subunit methyltransferase J n=1 Tax=Pseudomaricurvus hydrocarbonicus TaxID=1470433 RepID=A0A9E5JZ64_9GAMM|nr:class I SAM-dependent methyltransferase [Aestuariicella hydrocarbonica]NHO65147.1 class I SAM-dependent methyltransferase [Aestuariicella hydrocarbonica]